MEEMMKMTDVSTCELGYKKVTLRFTETADISKLIDINFLTKQATLNFMTDDGLEVIIKLEPSDVTTLSNIARKKPEGFDGLVLV
jgi:hypothetical protein